MPFVVLEFWETLPSGSSHLPYPSLTLSTRGDRIQQSLAAGIRRNLAIPSRRNSTHRSRRESTADGESLSGWNDHPHRGRGEPRAWPASGPTGETARRERDGEKRGRGGARGRLADEEPTRLCHIYEPQVSFPAAIPPFFLVVSGGKKGRGANWRLKSRAGRRNRSPRRRFKPKSRQSCLPTAKPHLCLPAYCVGCLITLPTAKPHLCCLHICPVGKYTLSILCVCRQLKYSTCIYVGKLTQ